MAQERWQFGGLQLGQPLILQPTIIGNESTVSELVAVTAQISESVGYEANFIDPMDNLKCIICLLVARDAHQMSCCGKLVCSSCITKWKQRNTGHRSQVECTHCRKRDAENFPDFRTQTQIKELRISCTNEDAGCDWSGKLPDKKNHEQSCNYRSVRCPNGCSQKIVYQNLTHHRVNECPKRKHECQACKKSGTYDDMVMKHPSICPQTQISCPNSCGKEMLRFQLDAHRASCPKEILSCPYSKAGCPVRMLREGLTKHTVENIGHHLNLAMNRITELEQMQVQSPPVTFKMPDYNSKLEMNQPWYSPPFYTSANASGYKMCLEVKIGPDDDYMSVKVYLMQGQNDDKLIWPFEGKVEVKMLNQMHDKDHYSAGAIEFSEKSLKEFNSRVTTGERSTIGLGHDRFISQDDLDGDDIQYLENDCIYFRISKVTVKPSCKPWLVQSLFHAH